MRTYNEAFEAAVDKRPFSNGSQGYGWMANWCDRCIHDKPARNDKPGKGCPLVLIAMVGKTPIEWLAQTADDYIFGNYHCIEFRDEDDRGGGREPRPIPDPPGQETLLPREQVEGVRMLVAADERQTAEATS